ncbi:MAG: crossover junction endodeoxyribonuclease RuvC [Patescibacteria group bacterium]
MLRQPTKILGIDPGYGRLGYAVLEKNGSGEKLLVAGCVETPKNQQFEKRLQKIGAELKKILKKYHPDALALEKLFLNTNQKTAMRVSETRGVVLYLCGDGAIYEFSPPEIKLAVCGYGRADKKQVEKMIGLIFKIQKNIADDAIDAIAIALTASILMNPRRGIYPPH